MTSTEQPSSPAWFSPLRLLMLFSGMSFLVYVDRGVISSNGVNGAIATSTAPGFGIQGDFGLSLFQDGILPAAFMVGLLGASLAFAQASKYYNGLRLIGIGLTVWTLAVAGGGLSVGFWSLVACRAAVGVGEASFVSLASTFIDDNAPAASKTKWLAGFYLTIPVGYACGYIFGGLVGSALGWRSAFWLEACCMAPFALFCLSAPPVNIKKVATAEGLDRKDSESIQLTTSLPSSEDGDSTGGQHSRTPDHPHVTLEAAAGQATTLLRDLRTLWRHPVYVIACLGTSIYTGIIGAYAYLGPKAGREVFDLAPETADIAFGVITVLTGVLGTVIGGVVLDRMGSSIPNACRLCAASVTIGGIFCALSFAVSRSLLQFAPLFAAGELGLFAIQAPSNAIVLWSVPSNLRPLACSLQIVVTHFLGDVPSAPLLGLLQGWLKNWRLSMSLCAAVLLGSTVLYLVSAKVAHDQPDYRSERHDLPPAIATEEELGGCLPQHSSATADNRQL